MDQEVKSSEKNFQQADKEQIDNNDLVLQARLQPQKKHSRQNSSIEARTLQNMRTMKNAHQLKPVLQQQSAQRVGKIAKTSREPSIENITTATVNASVNVERNKILIPREERRQVFSTHQNKDLVSFFQILNLMGNQNNNFFLKKIRKKINKIVQCFSIG